MEKQEMTIEEVIEIIETLKKEHKPFEKWFAGSFFEKISNDAVEKDFLIEMNVKNADPKKTAIKYINVFKAHNPEGDIEKLDKIIGKIAFDQHHKTMNTENAIEVMEALKQGNESFKEWFKDSFFEPHETNFSKEIKENINPAGLVNEYIEMFKENNSIDDIEKLNEIITNIAVDEFYGRSTSKEEIVADERPSLDTSTVEEVIDTTVDEVASDEVHTDEKTPEGEIVVNDTTFAEELTTEGDANDNPEDEATPTEDYEYINTPNNNLQNETGYRPMGPIENLFNKFNKGNIKQHKYYLEDFVDKNVREIEKIVDYCDNGGKYDPALKQYVRKYIDIATKNLALAGKQDIDLDPKKKEKIKEKYVKSAKQIKHVVEKMEKSKCVDKDGNNCFQEESEAMRKNLLESIENMMKMLLGVLKGFFKPRGQAGGSSQRPAA